MPYILSTGYNWREESIFFSTMNLFNKHKNRKYHYNINNYIFITTYQYYVTPFIYRLFTYFILSLLSTNKIIYYYKQQFD